MYPVAMSMALDNGSGKHRKGDEDLPDNKKKKSEIKDYHINNKIE